jgi:hypothetical protein
VTPAALALLRDSPERLDDRYGSSPAGPIPDGRADGTVLIAVGTPLAVPAAALVRRFIWQGKVFDRSRGELRNLVTPVGIQAVKARVSRDSSRYDGRESIVLDYGRTSLVARRIRDEIRELEPNVYLGFAYWGPLRVARFALTLSEAAADNLEQTRGGAMGLLGRLATAVDRRFGWDKLPVPLGLLVLVGLRQALRDQNLHDADRPLGGPVPSTGCDQHLTVRSLDGTCNDLGVPAMGAVKVRFGRNVPLAYAAPEPPSSLLTPNPRTVSRELLTRTSFLPANTLNVLAAAWLQFQIRDWLRHGQAQGVAPWEVPLADDDPWPTRPMRIPRTEADPPADGGGPPTYPNQETHWWDASQLYGSSEAFQQKLRSGVDGKLALRDDGSLPFDPTALPDLPGGVDGWWAGLALLHLLFMREHNAVCHRLKAEYPSWSDEELYSHARLVVAALIAKIHTVEWTTALLGHPTMQVAMRANWWGVLGERLHRLLGRIGDSEVLSGIPGSPVDHHGVPYSITEEFVAVYRMHPLIPDDYVFRSAADGSLLEERTFAELAGRSAQPFLDRVSAADALYSFGTAHPGAITLHNYPQALQRFERVDGSLADLAAIDILRVRERGTPRYNEFRKLLRLRPASSFEELTDHPGWADELRRVYDGDIGRVDAVVGMYAERPPEGFAFSDTAFRIFILMASRRLKSDRFFTTDFTPQVYTPAGLQWIADNTMTTVLLRHFPGLAPALRGVRNPFAPWQPVGAAVADRRGADVGSTSRTGAP